jgi:hypothetical protein
LTVVYSSNPAIISLMGRGIFSANSNGTANLFFSYGLLSGYNTYSVTGVAVWILGTSLLGTTTILG